MLLISNMTRFFPFRSWLLCFVSSLDIEIKTSFTNLKSFVCFVSCQMIHENDRHAVDKTDVLFCEMDNIEKASL